MPASKRYQDEVRKLLAVVQTLPPESPDAAIAAAARRAGAPPDGPSYQRAVDIALQKGAFQAPVSGPNIADAAIAGAVNKAGTAIPEKRVAPTHGEGFRPAWQGAPPPLTTFEATADAANTRPGGGKIEALPVAPGTSTPVEPSPEGAVFAQQEAGPAAPAPPSVQMVPAQTLSLISPERRAQLEEGYLGMQQGGQDAANAEASAAEDMARAKMHLAEDTRVDDLLAQKAQQDRDNEHLARVEALNKRAEDVFNKKIDPNHYYATRSTPQRILGIIGLFLGGIVQGATGRENIAASMINREIDRDIDAQEKNLASQRGKIEMQKGILAEQYRVYKDMDAAKIAARASMLQTAMMQLDAQAAQSQSAVIKARAEQQKGQLTHDYAREMATLEKYVPAHTVAVGGGVPAMGKLDEARFIPTGANGEGVYAPTAEEGKTFRDRIAITRDVQNAITQAVQIREAVHSGKLGKVEGVRQLARLQKGTMQRFNTLNGGGAMAGHEEQLSKTAIGSIGPSMLIMPSAVDVARGAVNDLETAVQQRMHGLPVVQSGFRTGPQGVVRAGGMTGATYQGGAASPPAARMPTFAAFGGK